MAYQSYERRGCRKIDFGVAVAVREPHFLTGVTVHDHNRNIGNAITVDIERAKLRPEEKESDREQENRCEVGCKPSHAPYIVQREYICKLSDHRTD